MATPSKKPKEEASGSASGYIMDVSPMKTSKRGFPYFNAHLQEEDKTSSVVGFNEKRRRDLKVLEEQRTPVTFYSVERVASYRTPGEFDIKLTNKTTISPAKLNYAFEGKQQTHKHAGVSLSQIGELPDETKVTVTAKVIKKLESVQQDLNFSRKMQRTTFIIADESTAIQLTLWGPEDQILVDNCYKFENLSIKVFECTKLSTNPYTRITKVDALQNVHGTDVHLIQNSNVKIFKGKICGVDIQLQYKCFFCKANVTINEDIQSLKCPECLKRQLTSTVSKNVKTELSIVIDNSTETFSLPQQVLDIYTLGVEKFEDKELFLLQHSNVEVKVFNNSIIKEMKQNF